jgi:hypothetical protein
MNRWPTTRLSDQTILLTVSMPRRNSPALPGSGASPTTVGELAAVVVSLGHRALDIAVARSVGDLTDSLPGGEFCGVGAAVAVDCEGRCDAPARDWGSPVSAVSHTLHRDGTTGWVVHVAVERNLRLPGGSAPLLRVWLPLASPSPN